MTFDVLIPGVAIAVSFISNECVYAGEREEYLFSTREEIEDEGDEGRRRSSESEVMYW